MKKILVVLLCLMAVFAVVSCKNEPTPEPTPDPPAPEPTPEPEWESGTLVVRPAEECTFSQTGKFQFQMAVEYNANEPIELLMYCSDEITAVTIRQAGGDNTRFISDIPVDDFEKTEDGWLIVKLTEDQVIPNVSPCFALGITLRVPDTERNNCYVAIKDMKINGSDVDFLEYAGQEDSFINAYYTSPDALDITIVE